MDRRFGVIFWAFLCYGLAHILYCRCCMSHYMSAIKKALAGSLGDHGKGDWRRVFPMGVATYTNLLPWAGPSGRYKAYRR
jgi:hypothetical protein